MAEQALLRRRLTLTATEVGLAPRALLLKRAAANAQLILAVGGSGTARGAVTGCRRRHLAFALVALHSLNPHLIGLQAMQKHRLHFGLIVRTKRLDYF